MTRADAPWARLLVVDDQEPNVVLLERMLESWGYLNVTTTTRSHEVPELCSSIKPDLLLLDLQMPTPNGFELLSMLQPLIEGSPRMPVLVLTADITTETRQRALSLGASDFLSKPLDRLEVRLRMANLLETRRLELDMIEHNQMLELRVARRTADLERARIELLERLALAAEYRDDSTHEHAQRVGRTAARLAEKLGMPAEEVDVLRRAAPLHDIGKIGVPDAILLKATPLSEAEFAVMKAHTTIGAQLLSGSEFPLLRTAEEIAASHHERWDGAGYPYGLAREEIPPVGRLVAIADVFDALVNERPYKPAWPVQRAVDEIAGLGGTHFDPDAVAAFATLDHHDLVSPIQFKTQLSEGSSGILATSAY